MPSDKSVWIQISLLLARWHELLQFEQGMIVGTRHLKHDIYEILESFDMPRSTGSYVYWEYLIKGIITHCGLHSIPLHVFSNYYLRNVARICSNRHMTLAQTTSNSYQTNIHQVSSVFFICNWRPMRLLLLSWHWTQCITWDHDIPYWMLGHDSCCLWLMVWFGCGENSMKTWIPFVNKCIIKTGDGSIIVHLNTSLTGECCPA